MTFKISNYQPGDRGPLIQPGTAAHAHATFIGALATYGVDSDGARAAYRQWQRLLAESQREEWNPEKWREIAKRERGRR